MELAFHLDTLLEVSVYIFFLMPCPTLSSGSHSDASSSFQDDIKNFDASLSDMVGNFSETVQEIYPSTVSLRN